LGEGGLKYVARALGFSHADVYKHVVPKAELRKLVVDRRVEATMEPLRAIVASTTPVPQWLRKLFDTLFATSRFHHLVHASEWKVPGIDADYGEVWKLLMQVLCLPKRPRPREGVPSARRGSPFQKSVLGYNSSRLALRAYQLRDFLSEGALQIGRNMPDVGDGEHVKFPLRVHANDR
jgi:AcrR family transcriptional regulator